MRLFKSNGKNQSDRSRREKNMATMSESMITKTCRKFLVFMEFMAALEPDKKVDFVLFVGGLIITQKKNHQNILRFIRYRVIVFRVMEDFHPDPPDIKEV